MTRFPLGPVLSIGAVALAAAFVGPSLLDGRAGEPIRVAVAERLPALQLTRADGFDCAPAQTLENGANGSGIQLLAVTLDADTDSVRVDEVSPAGMAPEATLFLMLDAEGRLIAIGDADTFSSESVQAALAKACDSDGEAVHGAI